MNKNVIIFMKLHRKINKFCRNIKKGDIYGNYL